MFNVLMNRRFELMIGVVDKHAISFPLKQNLIITAAVSLVGVK